MRGLAQSRKRHCQKALAVWAGLMLSVGVMADSIVTPTIAIIIDDLGHHYQNGADVAELPYPLTLSILPGRKHSQRLADLGAEYGKEIMLHVPMENIRGIALGKGALVSDMDELSFKASLLKSLASVPHVVGVNNHMGSLLTQQDLPMQWVMEALQTKPLYFVDSRTSASSVAVKHARQLGIPHMSRDIFLDHEQTPAYVRDQFRKLLDRASAQGTAIAIGHPHRVTIEFLRQALPKLDQMGFAIATASGVWQRKHPYARLHAPKQTGATDNRLASKSSEPQPPL